MRAVKGEMSEAERNYWTCSMNTGLTKGEAARLRNGYGKNYNGGEYDNPNVYRDPVKAFKMIAMAVVFVWLIS